MSQLDWNACKQCLQDAQKHNVPASVGVFLHNWAPQLLSELETLKAQLAQFRARAYLSGGRGGVNHTTACLIWGDDGQGYTPEKFEDSKMLPCSCGALANLEHELWLASEAQVRELRELLTKAAKMLDFAQSGVIFNPRNLLLDIEAALRSAPPSGPQVIIGVDVAFGSDATVLSCPNCHTILQAPHAKTNAGEERKDYVQSSDARDSRPYPFASSEGSPVVVAHTPTDAVGGASEQDFTPPPRCRVLVEGKPCGKRIYEGGSGAWYHTDNSDNHHIYLERRVSGERRKQWQPSTQDTGIGHRIGGDRRKAGK